MATNQKISHCKLIRGRDIQRGMKVSVVPISRGINAKRIFSTVADVNAIGMGQRGVLKRIQLIFYRFGGNPYSKKVMPDGLYLQQLRTRRPKAKKEAASVG